MRSLSTRSFQTIGYLNALFVLLHLKPDFLLKFLPNVLIRLKKSLVTCIHLDVDMTTWEINR